MDDEIAEKEPQDTNVWIQFAATGSGNPADGTVFFFYFVLSPLDINILPGWPPATVGWSPTYDRSSQNEATLHQKALAAGPVSWQQPPVLEKHLNLYSTCAYEP